METWGAGHKDVLERSCANCATRYPVDDPACPNCFAPAMRAYSRWRGGPLSLGLPTKLGICGALLALNAGHAVYMFSSLRWAAWPRVIEIGVILFLPIPFFFRRTRIR